MIKQTNEKQYDSILRLINSTTFCQFSKSHSFPEVNMSIINFQNFTMEDIANNLVEYHYLKDGSFSSMDQFEVSVSDTKHSLYLLQEDEVVATTPRSKLIVHVKVTPSPGQEAKKEEVAEKGLPLTPTISSTTNKGIKYLEKRNNKVPPIVHVPPMLCPVKRKLQILYFTIFFYFGIFEIIDLASIVENNPNSFEGS